MIAKPILLWPRRPVDIAAQLGCAPEQFVVVDTNCAYELRQLYKIKSTTPIFDPYPGSGTHYQEFSDHVAGDSGLHIVGLARCRGILEAQKDPSLVHASIEELLKAIEPDVAAELAVRWAALKRRLTAFDWSRLTWSNTVLAALLVFGATLTGNVLFPDDRLIAAAVAALLFAAVCVCVRLGGRSLSSVNGRSVARVAAQKG